MKKIDGTTRREFLDLTARAAVVGALSAGAGIGQAIGRSDELGNVLPTRRLGSTELDVSIYCAGGSHIARMETAKDAEKAIERYIERGVRFFDTAVAYVNGLSETYYGNYLTPKYRDHVHLFSKTLAKDAKGARAHVEDSMRRCKTDYFDFYLIHSISSVDDVESRLKNGVYDEMLKMKEEGKIGHIGFSGHRNYEAHIHLLEKNLSELEICLIPFNVADPSYRSFITNTVPLLQKRKMGILAMKTLAGTGFFGTHPFKKDGELAHRIIPEKISVDEALRFALSGPVASVVNGVDNLEQLNENLDITWNYQPMPEKERKRLISLCEEEGRTGIMEYFKEQI